MISVELLVVIIFRLINFAVVIGLGIFVFKRYLSKSIFAQIEAKKALIQGLISTDRMLVRQKNAVSRKIAEDREGQARIKEKLMRWRAAIDEEKNNLYEMREKRVAVFNTIIEKQAEKIQETMVARRLLPRIVDETREILLSEYADEKEQEQFMQKLIARMQEVEK